MDQLNIIIEKVKENQRIDVDEGLALFRQADFLTLASLANHKRFYYHPDTIVTYVVDRNINYTNICVSGCRFCAFFEPPNQDKGYIISKQDLFDNVFLG